ncbi:MAG TPA: 6,7-dimethyl-8-ribityllumazine synthase [Alphaproteobacteria bacterium]|nr:6,7-dimethyl-8-ribityllumazine synthase [Alphaproteobacteria bacterium]
MAARKRKSPARPPLKVLVVEARFYPDIADELARGAIAVLERLGVRYDRIAVPGAFELPAAIEFARRGRKGRRAFDGYVALGCVIRGETSHYDLVCNECARGLQELATAHGLAIGFGVLTCESRAQALKRAAVSLGDKGGSAARACLDMIALKRAFGAG